MAVVRRSLNLSYSFCACPSVCCLSINGLSLGDCWVLGRTVDDCYLCTNMFGCILDFETVTTAVSSVEQSIKVYSSTRRSVWHSSSAFVKSRYSEFCIPVCETKIT
jgi:hypothetical protein